MDSERIAGVIAVVGGVALLLMGLMMVWDVMTGKVSYSPGDSQASGGHRLVGKGFTATLSNPYWFVWWATVGLALLVQSQEHGVIGPIVFYVGHVMSDFVWYTVVSIVVWKGRKFLVGRGLKTLILVCAVFLLYLGGRFIMDGLAGAL